MQFEDQSAAMRQMKELLRDQAKFRAKLDRVVRKIETSSERTAKLAERNKARAHKHTGNGNGKPHAGSPIKSEPPDDGVDSENEARLATAGATSGPPVL